MVDKDVGHGAEAVDRRPVVFGKRRVGVARRPSAMVDAGGVGGAGTFGALASAEEEVVEEEVDIIFLPPKPKVKEKKEKKKEKTAAAAADAAEEAIESDFGALAAEAAAEAVVVRGGLTGDKLRDLEVLTIGSDPIDKTSEETADKEQTAAGSMQCTLVEAMLAAEAAEAAKVEKERAATVAAEEAAARRQQRIRGGRRDRRLG